MNKNDQAFDEAKQALRDIKDTLKAGGADVVEEVKGAAGDVRSAAADASRAARNAGAGVHEHARAAAGSVKVALDDAAETAGDAADDLIEDQRDTLVEWQARAECYAREKPIPAMAAAAAVGVMVGLWLRGSRQ